MVDEEDITDAESISIRRQYLKQRQSLPLDVKVKKSLLLIREFYTTLNGKVFVGFSGGKDSTVLLHLVRSIYPKVPAVFIDTGLEYPELKDFVKKTENVTIIRPKMNFKEVLETYGYPVVSKDVARKIRDLQTPHEKNKMSRHLVATGELKFGKNGKAMSYKLSKKWIDKFDIQYDDNIGWYSNFHDFKVSEKCCDIMKKKPINDYIRKTKSYPIIGTLSSDSQQRQLSYLRTGCNTYAGNIKSRPLSTWLEDDVWNYIKKNNLDYADIYKMGVHNTGCMFCMFGVHLEKEPNRFQQMKVTHPKLYDYCINTLKLKDKLDFLGVPYK